jgi:hypothetical protein
MHTFSKFSTFFLNHSGQTGKGVLFIEPSSTMFVYYLGDQTKEDRIGTAYGKCGGKQKCVQGSGQKPQGKRPLENLGAQCVVLECNIKNLR